MRTKINSSVSDTMTKKSETNTAEKNANTAEKNANVNYLEGKDPNTGRWKKGYIGGPGRPKGSRTLLTEKFLAVLKADFDGHGKEAVRRMREEDPSSYVRVIAGLVPKQLQGEDGGPIQIELSGARTKLISDLDAIASKEAAASAYGA